MALVKGQGAHVFGRTRPSHGGRFPIHRTQERDTHFRDLPDPTGAEPFHLDLKDIIAADDYQTIVRKKTLTFHLNGDMGGIVYGVPQELVAKGMEQDFASDADASENPAFLYITGDCVYFNGQVSEYYKQFYQPYELYPRPIFAVPGNHDGENLDDDGETSLDGFKRNFCAPNPVKMPESQDSHRTAMVQPNFYWTLLTPLTSIVGLYSNVPAGGDIRAPQTDWLVNELKTLPEGLPIILALHHPIYSADDHHSGSTHMKQIIEKAIEESGRHPEMIVAGHVHNYQRLTKNRDDGTQVPYLVTGAGGYHNLHHIMKVDGERMIPPVQFDDKGNDPVTLETYSDDHHGFLRLEVDSEKMVGRYYEVPRPQDPFSKGNHLLDYFEFDWVNKKYLPNKL
ncbi:MAG TPA: metallophosphoesterase [Candidatus Binataceae bacterium]|nr:metallophosphoesterase [Candidatus Binataceae bacterium]